MAFEFSEPTGLMFHHFHGEGHPATQGSIDANTFEAVLELVGIENILSADVWMQRSKANCLKPGDSCITFDDSLLCQYDVAKRILDKYKIKAFWFVYSSVLRGEIENLEIYRYFRTTQFLDIDHFYELFFRKAKDTNSELYMKALDAFDPKNYLVNSPFYSDNDRWFRSLRDLTLGPEKYAAIMDRMIAESGFCIPEAAKRLWLNDEKVVELSNSGHVIGLHSDTHPTTMSMLSRSNQRQEYSENSAYLMNLLGYRPEAMSHPCNSYSSDTLQILEDLDVVVGFRADVVPIEARSRLEYAREDHANLIAHML